MYGFSLALPIPYGNVPPRGQQFTNLTAWCSRNGHQARGLLKRFEETKLPRKKRGQSQQLYRINTQNRVAVSTPHRHTHTLTLPLRKTKILSTGVPVTRQTSQKTTSRPGRNGHRLFDVGTTPIPTHKIVVLFICTGYNKAFIFTRWLLGPVTPRVSHPSFSLMFEPVATWDGKGDRMLPSTLPIFGKGFGKACFTTPGSTVFPSSGLSLAHTGDALL